MLKFLQAIIILCIAQSALSQNYQELFLEFCQTRDTLKQKEILKKWEKSNPNDPELITSYYNYLFLKAGKKIVVLSEDAPDGLSYALKESSSSITAGYIGSEIYYSEKGINKAMKKIDEGIALYPNRLDMRFGKIYGLGKAEHWDAFTAEIIKAIEYSTVNQNKWTWTNNEPVPDDGEEFLLSSIQSYQNQLFYTENDDLLLNIRKIAIEIIERYPEHLESLSNISVTYMYLEEFDTALEYMFKALKLNEKDTIVLGNIAYAYYLKREDEKAISYYQKVIEYGDEDTKRYAEQRIEGIKADVK